MKKTKNNIKRGNLPTGGFYKTPRSIRNMHLYYAERFDKFHAYHDLLLKAHHSDDSFEIHGTKYSVKRGQVAISRQKLAVEWQWSINTVRKYLDSLQKRNFLITKNAAHLTIITMLYYDSEYYGDNQLDNQCDNQSDNSLEGIKKGGEGETTEEEVKATPPATNSFPVREDTTHTASFGTDTLGTASTDTRTATGETVSTGTAFEMEERTGVCAVSAETISNKNKQDKTAQLIDAVEFAHNTYYRDFTSIDCLKEAGDEKRMMEICDYFLKVSENNFGECYNLINNVLSFSFDKNMATNKYQAVQQFQKKPNIFWFHKLRDQLLNFYLSEEERKRKYNL